VIPTNTFTPLLQLVLLLLLSCSRAASCTLLLLSGKLVPLLTGFLRCLLLCCYRLGAMQMPCLPLPHM
jgi:hypothetical protein